MDFLLLTCAELDHLNFIYFPNILTAIGNNECLNHYQHK